MTGYLTLDHVDGDDLYLRIPNHEVGKMLAGVLSKAYTGGRGHDLRGMMEEAMEEGDMEKLASAFSEIIHIPTYDMRIGLERYYQSLVYFVAYGSERMEVIAEKHSAKGRADLVLRGYGRTVITEFKLNGDADEAVEQIEKREYMREYLGGRDEVLLLGVNIRTEGGLSLEWKAKRLQPL